MGESVERFSLVVKELKKTEPRAFSVLANSSAVSLSPKNKRKSRASAFEFRMLSLGRAGLGSMPSGCRTLPPAGPNSCSSWPVSLTIAETTPGDPNLEFPRSFLTRLLRSLVVARYPEKADQ